MSIKTKNIPSIIGLKDLRLNTSKYVSAVEKGRTFTIVRRSRPIFKMTPIDEWGDEGSWETVVDFTKFSKGGVKAEELLASLKRLEKYEQTR